MSRGTIAAVLVSATGGYPAELFSEDAAGDSTPSWHVSLGYTSDLWRNAEGGQKTGDTVLGNAELVVEWEGAPGGLRSRVHVIHNNGKSFSELVGDSHVVSNIEADRATRLLEGWVEYAPESDDRSIKVGLYNLNTEFDASEVGGALINSTFGIGVDAAQSGVSGPSIFPYTGLALRGRWRFDERWLLQGVVIDGVPVDPESLRKFVSLKLGSNEGALWVAELEQKAGDWRFVMGHWRYTSEGNAGTYGFVEGSLWQSGDRRLLGMLRLGAAMPKFNTIGSTVQAALVLERPWLRREGEHLALGIAYARNGRPARRLLAAQGETLLSNETVIELTWRVPIAERVALQPDVQYILNPGSLAGVSDALAFGLRIELDLTPH
ncbi:MAG: carbohydrate porin [Gammaproteobacteria bacterium]